MTVEYQLLWDGSQRKDRGLLCALDAMHPTRAASTVVPCYAQINRTKPRRILINEPKGINPRRGYHQAYYRRRRIAGKA